MMNKKGIELSVNFMVILILTIVVFGFGLYFTQQLFQGVNKIQAQLDSDAEANIRLRLDRGERFSIPISSKSTKLGQTVTFGVGLVNINLDPDGTNFLIEVECDSGITLGQQPITDACETGAGSLVASENPRLLKPNEKVVIPVAIRIEGSKPKGTYIFNVRINGGSPDYPTKQIYVNVD